jgi:hypothetical protein
MVIVFLLLFNGTATNTLVKVFPTAYLGCWFNNSISGFRKSSKIQENHDFAGESVEIY